MTNSHYLVGLLFSLLTRVNKIVLVVFDQLGNDSTLGPHWLSCFPGLRSHWAMKLPLQQFQWFGEYLLDIGLGWFPREGADNGFAGNGSVIVCQTAMESVAEWHALDWERASTVQTVLLVWG